MSKLFETLQSEANEESDDDDYTPPPINAAERIKRRVRAETSDDEKSDDASCRPKEEPGLTSWLPPPVKKSKVSSPPRDTKIPATSPARPEQTDEPTPPADAPVQEKEELLPLSGPASCAGAPATPGDTGGGEPLIEGYSEDEDEEEEPESGAAAEQRHDAQLPGPVRRQLGVKGDADVQLTTLSAASLRDSDWQHSNAAWSAANVVQEPGRLQKQKHQITWLAGRLAEDEKEIEGKAARMRDAKRQTRQRYGW